MKEIIHIEPLSVSKYNQYIKVGTKAYKQHYLHLWENQDATAYLESSFTYEVLKLEEIDKNTSLFLINHNGKTVGILKFTINCRLDEFTKNDALYVDKIYILKEYSGIGIGKKVLQFIMLRAKEHSKKVIWLDTMQNGPALHFYLKNKFKVHSEKLLKFSKVLEQERPMYVLTKKI